MNAYIDKLKEHLTSNEPVYPYGDVQSLLETLYIFYTEFNPITSEELQRRHQQLEPYLAFFAAREQDELFDIVTSICIEQERCAFLEGMNVGLRLAIELYEQA